MNVLAVCENKPGAQLRADGSEVLKVLQFKPQETVTSSTEGQARRQDVPAVIKVISAGGGGGNALNRMIEARLSGVEFIAANTDIQDLNKKSKADVKVQIGTEVTGGRGAGGVPEKGEKAAIEDQVAIAEALKGADMVFVTAGMGGGTGTGSAPVIAKIAKQLGALTVAVVTTPFEFEGRYKMRLAEEGIAKLREEVDTLIVIPNQYLFKIIDNTTSWNKAYLMADEVLCRGVQGISELITETGFMNTDFADVETIMKNKGDALMGIGFGTGENRALDAVASAIDNPLLEDTCIDGATGVLVNIKAPEDITMVEIQNIVKSIKEKCDPEAHIIQGLNIDPEFDNSIQLTVIATGFQSARYNGVKQTAAAKTVDSDFIDYNEYVRMVERTKRPEYLSYLPQKEYQDDLDVPSVIRKHSYHNEEKQVLETAETL
ncbi:MAG: cell division protein FtsZ [Treponema sp.]|nr:cell division protein FtsZ [Treponema sp.]MCL2237018.1 cell division protein FtsZ [Treponema sp.]